MELNADAYARQLQALCPPGAALNVDVGSRLSAFLWGLADELGRIQGRVIAGGNELDPRTTSELLTDWERVLGLPDPCVVGPQSIAQRRAAVVTRLTSFGGQSAAYFIALAGSLGYTVTITEFRMHTVLDTVMAPINGSAWAYAWQVNAPLNTVGMFTVKDPVNQPLAWWGNTALECVLSRLRPAHTFVIFAYA